MQSVADRDDGAAPRVSIVTISKDDPQGLQRSLESARRQSWQDFEHLLVLSGTSARADGIEGPGRRRVEEGRRGISHALNAGVGQARGEWVQFLNGGDAFSDPQSLQALVAAATPGVQMVCGFANVQGRGFTLPRKRLESGRDSFLYVSHQATLFRRELFERHGLFDGRWRIHMDLEWLCRLPPDTPFAFVDREVIDFDASGVSAQSVVRSSLEEIEILWRRPEHRLRALRVLALLLPFRLARREWRRLRGG